MARRPLDSDGKPPMPGQMDVDEVLAEVEREATDHPPSPPGEPQRPKTLSAAEVVALRLKGRK